MRKFISLGLSQLLLTTSLLSTAQAEPNPLASFMHELGSKNDAAGWLRQQEQILRNDSHLARRLSLELLAESLRQGPQPWPVQARATLEALLQIQPQPDIQEALNPNLFTPQTPLRELVQSASVLQQTPSLAGFQEQLNRCYRLNILTCQAEMQYHLGQLEALPGEDRLAAFQAGQESAEKAGHLSLALLNQMSTAMYEDYLDDYGSDILTEVLKEGQERNLTQIQALGELEWGRYLRDVDYEPEEAQSHFEKSLSLWSQPSHQAIVYFELGKNQFEDDEDAKARISWNQALALLTPEQDNKLYRQVLEQLSQSYLKSSTPALAIPYLESLLRTLPAASETQRIQKLRLAEALFATQPTQSYQLVAEVNYELKAHAYPDTFLSWLQMSSFYHRIGQIAVSTDILDKLIQNKALPPEMRIQALQQMVRQFPQAASHRALDLMRSEDQRLREAAVTTLNQLKSLDLLPKLIELLHDSDPRVRGNVIQVIWKTGGVSALPELLSLRNDANPHVRQNLIAALHQDPTKAAALLPVATLKEMMQDSDPQNVQKVASILAVTPQGLQTVLDMAVNPSSPQQFPALQTLHTVPRLSENALKQIIPLLASPETGIAHSASGLLSAKGIPTLWPLVVAVIQSKPTHSEAAVNVLRRWQIPEAVRQLKAFATSQDPQSQNIFISLFASIPMPQEDILLIKHFLNPDVRPEQRWPAVTALLRFNYLPAWQQFEQLFATLPSEKIMSLQGVWDQQIPIPCLPPSAFIHAPDWQHVQANQLSSYYIQRLLRATDTLYIWNGSACGPFTSLKPQTQQAVKEALVKLYASDQPQFKAIVLTYLKAWAPEAL